MGSAMTVYRGIEIIDEQIGTFGTGTGVEPIRRCRATINGKTVKGSPEDIKRKIDEELGPEPAAAKEPSRRRKKPGKK